jgi:hypothetical protein
MEAGKAEEDDQAGGLTMWETTQSDNYMYQCGDGRRCVVYRTFGLWNYTAIVPIIPNRLLEVAPHKLDGYGNVNKAMMDGLLDLRRATKIADQCGIREIHPQPTPLWRILGIPVKCARKRKKPDNFVRRRE